MPRKKKSANKPKKPVEPKIQELEGFRLGDIVSGRDHIGKIYDGEIVQFYPGNKEGPCLMVITPSSGYRLFLISSCSFDKKELEKSKKKAKKGYTK